MISCCMNLADLLFKCMHPVLGWFGSKCIKCTAYNQCMSVHRNWEEVENDSLVSFCTCVHVHACTCTFSTDLL